VRPALPVDSFVDIVREALDRHRAAVLVAAPGAGKTTRVPPALVDRGRVLLLQPRRVAARAMARRIAMERGWTLGREVGWHIRFERQFTRETQLLVVTEGILTSYLQEDPLLSDVATLILDEFHERSVHADLGLALARQAWQARSDLRMVVMSATLDTQPIAAFLGGCPVIDVAGSLHPLTIDYAPGQSVAQAVQQLLPRTTGNVLCFLPGVTEINAAIAGIGSPTGIAVVPLHGGLDGHEQDAALSPDPARRRIIVATNIAETSLTVSGVSAVIDSGLHKVARYDAERGVDSLTTERVTLDSADQRAGRAGRLEPGTVLRLWDSRDRLRPHREAEIHRVNLAGPLLSILAWGGSPATFEWFDRPSDDRIELAMTLLERLGAVTGGAITPLGRQLQRLPLHPRLGRVLLEARGSFEGAAACAWLSEPMKLEAARASSSCDLLPIIDRWPQVPAHLKRIAQMLAPAARLLLGSQYRSHVSEEQLRRALLAGYPDRVASRRPGPQKAQTAEPVKVTLATGHGAIIGRESGVRGSQWIVALDVTSGRAAPATEAIVRLASAIESEWLSPTRSEVVTVLNGDVIRAREVDWYDEIVLHEHPIAVDPRQRVELLVEAWLDRGPDDQSQRLLRRLDFAGVKRDVDALARAAAQHARTLADVVLNEDALAWQDRQQLDRLAPATLTVPSGRDMRIDYGDGGSIGVSVKLQELFGLAETPRIGPARTPITFHLLAPNGRPVQTTQDLGSFWERTYPEVRKELRGRYPRHPWPEDPWNAPATHRTKKRR
jgi:ATP-dependent helicase HrpB